MVVHIAAAAPRIDELLARNGAGIGVADLDDLIDGVLAAPPGTDPDAWMTLVAPPNGDGALAVALRSRYRARAAEMAAHPLALALGQRPAALRAELRRRRLTGFVVPRADEHQGEYVPAHADRLAWLTGFSGSAGMAIVLRDRAAIFIDGRYTLQVRDEVDAALFEYRHISDQPASAWLADHLKPRHRLGYDPWLHTARQVAVLGEACAKAGAVLVACDDNPLDAAWPDQPPPPIAPVVPHDIAYAGRAAADKRAEIAGLLRQEGTDAALISAPDSIAWLLNIRGGDVPCTPLPLAFALIHADGAVDLCLDRRKLVAGIERHVGTGVRLHDRAALGGLIDAIGGRGGSLRIDPATAPFWAMRRAKAAGARVDGGSDPCQLPKARKNAGELAGTRAAHRRDGAALSRFLAWLVPAAAGGGLSESQAAAKLESLRVEDPLFRGLSFPTISGAGPNGAIVHYRVSERTDRRLEPGSLYLVDSGGQYLDGTTDVTRTLAIGPPTAAMRGHFTRVLKGHIALASVRFPRGTTGSQLDVLARHALWQAGLDYDHGTGHGVGSYLGVHEGPQRISKAPGTVALEPGMIVSNEPGYYRTGAYGIRIENLVVVVEADIPGAERPFLAFETLTLAPFDRALIDTALLGPDEIAWVDAYHARVCATHAPNVDAATATWLAAATRPLPRD